MDIATIVGAVPGTSFATAVFNQLFTSHRERKKLGRDAKYLAIRLAVILEQFAIECAERIAAMEMYQSSKGGAGSLFGKLPELPAYPEEAKWEALDANLLARALTLKNELPLSDRAIAFWEDIDRTSIPAECAQQCGKCGYMAWELAVAIRAKYGFPPFDPRRTSWDLVQALRTQHDDALRRARERAA